MGRSEAHTGTGEIFVMTVEQVNYHSFEPSAM
jgi:hypothetical protein